MPRCEDHGLYTGDGDSVPLRGVQLKGDLRGLLFEAAVEQRFRNIEERHVEVVYTFPLPWQAVLLGVEVRLGERSVTGCCVEKREAEARYEAALCTGDAAILLEKNRDHSYTLNLGHLAPGEDAVITLRYAQTLAFEGEGLRLVIPTVIAPRYGDAIREGGLQPHQVVEHSVTAHYPFAITIGLHGAFRHATVSSPSHPVRDESPCTANAFVRTVFSLSRHGALDRDFVLVLEDVEQDSLAVIARDAVDPEKVAVLASFRPRIPALDPIPVNVKLLVDCSGSMNGDSLAAAQRALHGIVEALAPGDRFSLSRFGDTVEHRSRSLWDTTPRTQQAARRWIDGLHADLGGTRMEEALMSTFRQGEASARDVLLISDGEISAIDRTIIAARHSPHRLFIVGIGSSPAESHLRRLAEATGGASDFVAPGEAVGPAVLRMFTRLRSPRLANFALRWPEGCKPLWQSFVGKAAFNGDTVHVFALLDHVPVGTLCLDGIRNGDPHPEEIGRIRFDGEADNGTSLSRLAAMVRLEGDPRRVPPSATADAVQLALDYQLLTEYTDFFLVHRRDEADKPNDLPVLRPIKSMLPAGWGGLGTVTRGAAPRYGAGAIPAVVRRAPSCFAPPHRDPVNGRDDIPAFLRRQAAETDRRNPQHWTTTEVYTGLTPLGFAEYLKLTARDAWPTTYADLRACGLGTAVVDWLEMAVASDEADLAATETAIVAVFNEVMALPATQARLAGTPAWRRSTGDLARHLTRLFSPKANAPARPTETKLAEHVRAALANMTATEWPATVFALESVG